MEIKNFKDLKDALNKIPDLYLEELGVGMSDDGLTVGARDMDYVFDDYFSSEIKKYSGTSMNVHQFMDGVFDLHPEAKLVSDYINKIISCAEDVDSADDFISVISEVKKDV